MTTTEQTQLDAYAVSLMKIANGVTLEINSQGYYLRAAWNMFLETRGDFNLVPIATTSILPTITELAESEREKFGELFAILEAAKVIARQEAIRADDCGESYKTAVYYAENIPFAICSKTTMSTCELEEKIVNDFAVLSKKCNAFVTTEQVVDNSGVVEPVPVAVTGESAAVAEEIVE